MSDGDDGRLRNTLYRTATRSSRRMTRARRALYAVAAPLGVALIRAWWLTCRVVRIEEEFEYKQTRYWTAVEFALSCLVIHNYNLTKAVGDETLTPEGPL